MKYKIVMSIIALLFVFIPVTVNAEECSIGLESKLNTIAGNVEIEYEVIEKEVEVPIINEDDGSDDIAVFSELFVLVHISNLESDIKIVVTNNKNGDIQTYTNADIKDGRVTFETFDHHQVIEYTFKIYDVSNTCTNVLRTITLKTPKENYLRNMVVCFEEGTNFFLCDDILYEDKDYTYGDFNDEYNKYISKEENEADAKEKGFFSKYWYFFVIGGLVMVSGTAGVIIYNKRREENEK